MKEPAQKTKSLKQSAYLKQLLEGDNASFPTTLLVYAADTVRINRFIDRAEAKLLPQGTRALRYNASSLQDSDLKRLAEDLFTPSLFTPHSLVVIRNIHEAATSMQHELLTVVKDLEKSRPFGTTLIICGKELQKSTILHKHFESSGNLALFETLTGEVLERWILKEFSREGITQVSPQVIASLVTLTGEDLDALIQKIEHLAMYAHEGTVQSRDIDTLFQVKSEINEYDLLQELSQGAAHLAQKRLAGLIDSDKSPFLLLSLLARSYCQFSVLRSLLDRGATPESIADTVKMPPWLLKKQITFARRYTMQALERALCALVRADALLKNRSLGHEIVLSELIDVLAVRA
jgi:DNA polymerase III delta subunit